MTRQVSVRRVRAAEWERLRSLRLRALADAPLAFGSTLAREQAFPDQVWRQRASGSQAVATFAAERATEWLGLATGYIGSEGSGARPAWVAGMWVDPSARRQGIAQALLRAIATWARPAGADVLNLWVVEANTAAVAAYGHFGFHRTGVTQSLPHTPELRELHMACPLAQGIVRK